MDCKFYKVSIPICRSEIYIYIFFFNFYNNYLSKTKTDFWVPGSSSK